MCTTPVVSHKHNFVLVQFYKLYWRNTKCTNLDAKHKIVQVYSKSLGSCELVNFSISTLTTCHATLLLLLPGPNLPLLGMVAETTSSNSLQPSALLQGKREATMLLRHPQYSET